MRLVQAGGQARPDPSCKLALPNSLVPLHTFAQVIMFDSNSELDLRDPLQSAEDLSNTRRSQELSRGPTPTGSDRGPTPTGDRGGYRYHNHNGTQQSAAIAASGPKLVTTYACLVSVRHGCCCCLS